MLRSVQVIETEMLQSRLALAEKRAEAAEMKCEIALAAIRAIYKAFSMPTQWSRAKTIERDHCISQEIIKAARLINI